MTSVQDIYKRLLVIIEDSRYCKLSDQDVEFILSNYLENSITMFKEFNRKYKPILVEDEFGELRIKKTKNDSEEDLDLEEQNILAYGMLLCWHQSQMMRDEALKQRINTKDFNQLSNATMLGNNEIMYKTMHRIYVKRRRAYKNNDWNGAGL